MSTLLLFLFVVLLQTALIHYQHFTPFERESNLRAVLLGAKPKPRYWAVVALDVFCGLLIAALVLAVLPQTAGDSASNRAVRALPGLDRGHAPGGHPAESRRQHRDSLSELPADRPPRGAGGDSGGDCGCGRARLRRDCDHAGMDGAVDLDAAALAPFSRRVPARRNRLHTPCARFPPAGSAMGGLGAARGRRNRDTRLHDGRIWPADRGERGYRGPFERPGGRRDRPRRRRPHCSRRGVALAGWAQAARCPSNRRHWWSRRRCRCRPT